MFDSMQLGHQELSTREKNCRGESGGIKSFQWITGWGLLALLPLLCCPMARAVPAVARSTQGYRLCLYDLHTEGRIDVVYRRGNEYIPSALAKLDYFLRDRRTGDIRHFDPKLFDLLVKLSTALGRPNGEIDVVCGYRTPQTNQFLRIHTAGVAEHSLHMQAMAIDIRIPGVRTSQVRETALMLHQGGVGYYPHSNFVHVDIGRVRQWCLDCTAKQATAD